jgi:Flp pilus assembly protein protease CpaA
MKNIGFVIAVFSLVSIVYSDFKFRKATNLSLVFLALGLGIFLPSQNLLGSTVQLLVSGGVLILIDRFLSEKTKIQAGDLKLILVLSFFLQLEKLFILLIVSSVFGLMISLKKNNREKIPLAGIISSLLIIGISYTVI